MDTDAIVNTANKFPLYGDGIDTAVYKAAGAERLLAERAKIGVMEEGEAAITPGFDLPAKYIIHAVSPRYIDGESGEEERLRSCYRKSLALAKEYDCKSIAIPLIATGSFGYPKEEGMRIAVDEIHAFLLKYEMLVYLVVFDTMSTKLGLNIYPDLIAYIDHRYVCDKCEEEYENPYFNSVPPNVSEYNTYSFECREMERRIKAPVMETCIVKESCSYGEPKESAIQERIQHMADTFQEYLFYLIEQKGLSNAEVYKRAIMTKQTFSKIKKNPKYHPDKATALKLCIGAMLNLDETRDILARAGYALSPCDKRDIVFSYFIEHEIYDMIEIDIVLEELGLPCFIV